MDLNLTLLGEMITFMIFVWLTMRYIWPPVMKMLEARRHRIAEGIEAAEKGERSMVLARNRASAILLESKLESSSILDRTNKKANAIIDEAKSKSLENTKKSIENASREIYKLQATTKESLKNETVSIATLMAEKILNKTFDKDAHNALIDELIAEIG